MDLEHINIKMDQLAAVAYNLPHELPTSPEQEVLLAEKIDAFYNGAKITMHLKKSILHACHLSLMETYVTRKYNLSEYDMGHVNWKGN